MSKSNATEQDYMNFVLNGVAMPNYGANLSLALHTADPGEGGDQSTFETTYPNYARITIVRDNTGNGFQTTGNPRYNTNLLQFNPANAVTSETLNYISLGLVGGGATQILYSGALTTPLTMSNLVQPQILAGGLGIAED